MMKCSVAIIIYFLYVCQCEHKSFWSIHKIKHGLSYDEKEDASRFQIFSQNVDYINKVNTQNLGYTLEANKFAHWTKKEYMDYLMTPREVTRNLERSSFDHYDSSFFKFGIDWRDKDGVTPVKDQGPCGSCWAFSAVGALESSYLIQQSKNYSFSEQQVVDCSGANHRCDGGWPTEAFKYISKKGIELSKDYDYHAKNMDCDYDRNLVVEKPKGYKSIMVNEKELAHTIKTIGPVSVCIDASKDGFRFYKSGIFYDPTCTDANINHAVLAVGYGMKHFEKYYIIKNSWGTDWGDGGYILMARDKGNHCGIASDASYPIL